MAKKKRKSESWRFADGLGPTMGLRELPRQGTVARAKADSAERPRRDLAWRPPEFPDLSRATVVRANYETTGLDWRGKDEAIACAVEAGGRTWYLPWGHRGGGNIEDGRRKFTEWANSPQGLRGKRIENPNMKFDAHFSRKLGVDLDTLGCELSDPQHWAGLLNDHRKVFGVDTLVAELLGETPMPRLNESMMAEYHAGQAAPRSEWGVLAIGRLKDAMWPILDLENLQAVRQLEDDVLPAVVEMEKNGAPLDVSMLTQWKGEIEGEIDRLAGEIVHEAGLAVQERLFEEAVPLEGVNSNSGKEMERLFGRLGLSVERTKTGRPRFDADALQDVEHPVIKKIVRQGKLLDLMTKYVTPYLSHVDGNGILRYELHQMKGDENGTVRGRFSSSDVNIQQVLKAKKQLKTYGPGWVIRDLFTAPPGRLFVSGDAAQIEYRILADYLENEEIFAAYARDPWLNFHTQAEQMIATAAPGSNIDYDGAKTSNFLTVYGGGLAKSALQLGFINGRQFRELTEEFSDKDKYPFGIPHSHPLLARALKVRKAYAKALPEVRPLAKLATAMARDRGYVKDMLGRRARFHGKGEHAALNAVIQPSAAEVMKRKMVEVHRMRRELGVTPRMTIHDDWLGDCDGLESARRLAAQLNRQSFHKLRVPILWEVKAGPRWSRCLKVEAA